MDDKTIKVLANIANHLAGYSNIPNTDVPVPPKHVGFEYVWELVLDRRTKVNQLAFNDVYRVIVDQLEKAYDNLTDYLESNVNQPYEVVFAAGALKEEGYHRGWFYKVSGDGDYLIGVREVKPQWYQVAVIVFYQYQQDPDDIS